MPTGPRTPQRLFVYNGGFRNARLRRILGLAGWQVTTGWPGPDDWIGVWGRSPTAYRGEAVAARSGASVLRIEDPFLRSIHPGRAGEPPAGLLLDRHGVHFESTAPSDIELILAKERLDDPVLLTRARDAIRRIRSVGLSKYNGFDPARRAPPPGYVLVIDQVHGDAAVRSSDANAATFRRMLDAARANHPGQSIVIRGHPDSAARQRKGHFTPETIPEGVAYCTAEVSPWAMLENAEAVYTTSSHMGFEAILAGHRPKVFGTPFYAGWGLSEDQQSFPRRGRPLSAEQLFAAAMILYPTWYCPNRDRLCELEQVLDGMEARVAAFRQDRFGHVAVGMSRWKRRQIRRIFGDNVRFSAPHGAVRSAAAHQSGLLIWAGKATSAMEAKAATAAVQVRRVEDGFLRSRGLGAGLVPALSLVADDLGIHSDPSRESRLERLIAAATTLPPDRLARIEALIQLLTARGLSKYNLGAAAIPSLPRGHRILVPGQVEDDFSVLCGAGVIRTNLALLKAVRATNPAAVIIYKPHPDVEAGLRRGHVPSKLVSGLADCVVTDVDPSAMLECVDEVWTLTSLIGFEALLRGRRVTCLGAPFYAGWGLTTDLGEIPARRTARPSLSGLAHAALIDYPRYFDPISGQICAVEVIVDRLSACRPRQTSPIHEAFTGFRGFAARLFRPG